uniref:Uncharacterized protein n=1 Tax=Solanum tuberosum TaxID=4113 RepID=M1BDR8_SOLTU
MRGLDPLEKEKPKPPGRSSSLFWRHEALSTAMAVGETSSKINYASLLHANSSSKSVIKTILNPVELVHGKLTIKFTMDEIVEFTREKGLRQAIVIKFSYGHPDLNDICTLIPK